MRIINELKWNVFLIFSFDLFFMIVVNYNPFN